MYICVCKAVTERQLRRAIREEGLTSLRDLARLHGVGTGCGKCVPQARAVLDDTLVATPCAADVPLGVVCNHAAR